MIIKLLGMGIIMLSSSLMGICFAECMASREKELINLLDAAEMISNELSYSMSPIKDIVCSIAPMVKGVCAEMFGVFKEQIEKGKTASEAWSYALDKKAAAMSLKKEDASYLKMLSTMFDAYEIDEQKRRINELKLRLSSLADNAQKAKNKNSKIAKMLGVYGGVLLCVIIF